MDILFLYNFDIKEYNTVSVNIEESIKNILKDLTVNIVRKEKINSRTKADIYVIFSDDSKEANAYFEKIKDKEKSIVLTNNISASNILNLIKNTKNVCYMKNDVEMLVRKIYSVYSERKEKYV